MSKELTPSLLHLQLFLFLAKYAFILKHKSPKNFSGLNLKLNNFLEYAKSYSLKFSETFKPISVDIKDCNIEVHTLLCKRDLHMYLWAIRSLIYYTEIKCPIVVHDDGSLDEKDFTILKSNISNIRIISKTEADLKVTELIKGFENCSQYRKHSNLALKLFDYNLLSEADFILSFDSDILFFKKAEDLIKILDDKSEMIFYNEEVSSKSYRSDPVLVEQFNSIINGFNSGLLFYPRKIFSLTEVEPIAEWLLKNKHNIKFRTGEQIVNSILAGRREAQPLAPTYSTSPTSRINADNLVAKHYHSAMKGLFWLEGIRTVIQNSSECFI